MMTNVLTPPEHDDPLAVANAAIGMSEVALSHKKGDILRYYLMETQWSTWQLQSLVADDDILIVIPFTHSFISMQMWMMWINRRDRLEKLQCALLILVGVVCCPQYGSNTDYQRITVRGHLPTTVHSESCLLWWLSHDRQHVASIYNSFRPSSVAVYRWVPIFISIRIEITNERGVPSEIDNPLSGKLPSELGLLLSHGMASLIFKKKIGQQSALWSNQSPASLALLSKVDHTVRWPLTRIN